MFETELLIPEQFMFETKLFIPKQFRFRKLHYHQHNARIINEAKLNYIIKHTTSMTIFDEALIFKMIFHHFPLQINLLIEAYLSNRKISVKINNCFSEISKIPARLPQGGANQLRLVFNLYQLHPKEENHEVGLVCRRHSGHSQLPASMASSYQNQ